MGAKMVNATFDTEFTTPSKTGTQMWHQKCTVFANKFAFFFSAYLP